MSQAYLNTTPEHAWNECHERASRTRAANGYYKSGGNRTDAYSWSRRINVEGINFACPSRLMELFNRKDKGTELASTLRQTVRADLYRYCGQSDKRAFLSAYLHQPGFRFTYHLRKVSYYGGRKRSFRIFAYLYNRIMFHHYRFKYGFDISPTTSIGPGLFIGHFGGVVISPYAILGSNINIAQGVTIGAASRGPRTGAPTLEDRVWVGANAIIVGKVTIGHDALIAPGAFVNFDVPSMAVILGNPGKVISSAGSIGYVNRTLDISPVNSQGVALSAHEVKTEIF
jgi:serine O-acetyltransferase